MSDEDWDSQGQWDEHNNNSDFGSGFQEKKTWIAGRGRGLGFSNAAASKPGGLSNNDIGNSCDGWDETPAPSGGFGSSAANDDWNETPRSGGFASRGGFGTVTITNNRFGGSSDKGRGRFIRGSGPSKGCFKCGEEGHMSRECPNPGSGGRDSGNRKCHKCGEEGHISRNCPNNDSDSAGFGSSGFGGGSFSRGSSRGGRGRGGASSGGGCHKCGEEGHFSRNCPNNDSSSGGFGSGTSSFGGATFSRGGSRGGRGRGGGGSGCHKCGEEGNFSRNCPNNDSGSGGFGSDTSGFGGATFNRGGARGGRGRERDGGSSGRGCYKCNEEGHLARDCPNAEDKPKPKTEIYIPPDDTEDETEIYHAAPSGINFDKYCESIEVSLTGSDNPDPIQSFDEANLSETCLENVKKSNYQRPTPVQKYSIPCIMNGRDLMACAQTGSGKTAAFLLPIITCMIRDGLQSSQFSEVQEPQCIIVAPTRELVIQIHGEARKFARGSILRPVEVYGGTSVSHQLSQISKGCNLLTGTPGRLLDFIGKGKIGLGKVQYLVLDEADRMLDMGFEPEIRKLVTQFGMPEKTSRQTLMFSATFPAAIQTLAADFLNEYLFLSVGRVGGANTDVQQEIFQVDRYSKRDKLMDILNDRANPKDKILVFVETKRNADFLATFLSQSSTPTTSIHGDRLQREREEALKDFMSGKTPCLIATSVAARGLDIPEVKHVINFDLPEHIEDYVHRIGRTGRCGHIGKATSFFDPGVDGRIARALVKTLAEAEQEVPVFLEESAQGNIGTSSSNDFGSRDVRRGGGGRRGGGNKGGQDDDWGDAGNSAPSFGGFSNTPAADEDESWD